MAFQNRNRCARNSGDFADQTDKFLVRLSMLGRSRDRNHQAAFVDPLDCASRRFRTDRDFDGKIAAAKPYPTMCVGWAGCGRHAKPGTMKWSRVGMSHTCTN